MPKRPCQRGADVHPVRHRPRSAILEVVPGTIYTIGHSNLASETFFARLADAHVTCLADVRAFPGSRRHPQFGRAPLAHDCHERDVDYHWLPGLGGRRRSVVAASPHVAWQVAAFRAYADYADGPEFAAALAELETLARERCTAFLCAEALWWQCHRRLIADRLTVAGWRVLHLGARAPEEHHLPDFARVVSGRIVYDGGTTGSLL
jgi:uncharacterized protein (DUF488 family)